MMEPVDMLGLGSSFYKLSKGSNPFFGNICQLITNFQKKIVYKN
jgi:hypothetical protein